MGGKSGPDQGSASRILMVNAVSPGMSGHPSDSCSLSALPSSAINTLHDHGRGAP